MLIDLSEKLKTLRLKKGLSQSQVAEILGITPAAVSAYECDIRTPTLPILIRFSSLYQVSTDYLLGISPITNQDTLDVSGLQPDEKEALKIIVNAIRTNHE